MFSLYIVEDSKNTIPKIEIIASIGTIAVMREVMNHTRRKLNLLFLLPKMAEQLSLCGAVVCSCLLC